MLFIPDGRESLRNQTSRAWPPCFRHIAYRAFMGLASMIARVSWSCNETNPFSSSSVAFARHFSITSASEALLIRSAITALRCGAASFRSLRVSFAGIGRAISAPKDGTSPTIGIPIAKSRTSYISRQPNHF